MGEKLGIYVITGVKMGIGLQGRYVFLFYSFFFSCRCSFLVGVMSRGRDTWPITCVEDS